MLWIILLVLLIIIAGRFYYKYYVRPKMISKWYKDTLEIMGYNVLSYPYQPYKIMLYQNQKHNERQYGDCFYDQKNSWKKIDVVISNTSYMITLIFINPRLIRHMFTPEKHYIFHKAHINKFGFKLALGNTMIMNEDDAWKKKRKILSEIFNFDFIKRNIPKMKDICRQKIQKMEKQSEIVKENQSFISYQASTRELVGSIISNIVIRCFFGGENADISIQGKSINAYLSDILMQARNQSSDLLVILFGQKAYHWGLRSKYRKLKSQLVRLKAVVKEIIHKRSIQIKQSSGNLQKYTDIYEAMCLLRSKGQSNLSNLEEDEIIEQFCAFMAAGNDSTSVFTTMCLYYLCQNPEVQQVLRKQIEKHVGSVQLMDYESIKKIQYLQWVQLQTSRMFGPATSVFLRQAIKDTSVDNIPILKGTGLKIQLLPNHYSEQYFDNPHKFHPQRWRNRQQKDSYVYGGFGFGARTCLGKHLAYLSSKIVIIMMLKRYKKLEIVKNSMIRFQFRGFYSPSPFETILSKTKEEKN